MRFARVAIVSGSLFASACGDDDGSSSAGGPAGGNGAGANGAGGEGTGAGTGTAGGSASGQPDAVDLYGDGIDTIAIEVDYMAGAEPYTGEVLNFGDLWALFRTNAERLFQGRGKTFIVPSELSDMEAIDVSGDTFDVGAILDIADAHRDSPSEGSTATFYFVWLDGHYEKDGEVQDGVLGVSIGGSGVVAMFKPVIESTGAGPGLNVEKFVEQATLVHEFGHAVGLVNNGVDITSAHHDEAHGAHCNNQDCVMYWQIEGTAGAIEFATQFALSSDAILFGSECLDDTAAVP
jgi:hypothetical protein